MARAIGITIHTGWAACVVAGGSPAAPEIVANTQIRMLDDSERFCFHMAAEMVRATAAEWLDGLRAKAIENARSALAPLIATDTEACALVAKEGEAGDLAAILASHPRIHSAEGFFYRDVLRVACPLPCQLVPPRSLDPSTLGKRAAAPWGRDQKLAALAAWRVLGRH